MYDNGDNDEDDEAESDEAADTDENSHENLSETQAGVTEAAVCALQSDLRATKTMALELRGLCDRLKADVKAAQEVSKRNREVVSTPNRYW